MPPELIYLPSWFPLNVYDWACWARQTDRAADRGRDRCARSGRCRSASTSSELRARGPGAGAGAALDVGAGSSSALDAVLHALRARGPARPARGVRRAAMRRAAEWILARQEADGGWGGIQPPWVYSLMALHLLGYRLDHPSIASGDLAGSTGSRVTRDTPDGPVRRLEACQSPVWDTVLAIIALHDAGVPADDPAVVTAAALAARRGDHRAR